ncbi:MAG: HDOD domain-containing protein, partial [Desulfuromusa sp.]|nr:HDOD domain-containing protein [Desulfuromusa sp.]
MINSKADYLIQENIQLPSLPAVAIKILDAVKEEETALVKLAEIISVDPALSAKMLKVANSSLFALSNEVTSISRAIIVLGIDSVKNIALSFVLIKNMSSNDVTGVDIDYFWRRSISIAVSAELLSTHLNYTDDSMFLTALLQDLGLLAILSRGNQEDNIFLYQKGTDHKDLIQREREHFGFDHQQVGYSLFQSWNFPESISIPILHHHCPDMVPKRYQTETKILFFADRLANIYHQK